VASTGDWEFRAPALIKASSMTIQRPMCPKCQISMMLARITSGHVGFRIHTFECPACDLIHQLLDEAVDPMKCANTLAWFRGELQAPT